MKKLLKIATLISAVILLSSAAHVRLNLLKPAVINVPQHIQSIVVIDRSAPPSNRQNQLEEVLTGEFFRQDEQAAQSAIDGLIGTIKNSPRFEIVRGTERYKGDNSGTIFPEAMNWELVKNLCDKYNVDGVIALETFDTDYIVTNARREVEQKDDDGNVKLVMQHIVEGVATINLGFRFYDPTDRGIADQFNFSENKRWESNGSTAASAAQGILDKTASINQTARYAGELYGTRISPQYYTVSRYIYNKPNKNKKLMEGVRKSEVADWEGAIEAWKEAASKGKDKHRGRATYNVAVGYEVLGDLDKALEWSAKAYTEYEDKRADDYHRSLKQRINQENIVNYQMGE